MKITLSDIVSSEKNLKQYFSEINDLRRLNGQLWEKRRNLYIKDNNEDIEKIKEITEQMDLNEELIIGKKVLIANIVEIYVGSDES